VGSGTAVSAGMALVTGAGTVTVGTESASGEVIAGSVATGATTGATGAAASGAGVDPAHVTHVTRAKRTSGRTAFLPATRPSKSPASRPWPQRKQVVVAVHSAWPV
jgi:hypothetical protein